MHFPLLARYMMSAGVPLGSTKRAIEGAPGTPTLFLSGYPRTEIGVLIGCVQAMLLWLLAGIFAYWMFRSGGPYEAGQQKHAPTNPEANVSPPA